MKKLLIGWAFCLFGTPMFCQLLDGSIAPDFTATDINGVEWNLYDVLDQGKTVVMDISATWCGPCWVYHTSGELENYYEAYGPSGTNESFVFFIEGDESTTLEDLHGTGDNTQGNWVENTPYPIIDSRDIAEAYGINFFPTIYMICPDRKIKLIDQVPVATIHSFSNICPMATENVDASILKYYGFEGLFCDNVHFPPSISLQNFGLDNLNAATVNLLINGNIAQQINWTGNLSTYHTEEIVFDSILVNQSTQLAIKVENPNGTMDDDPSNNQYLANIEVAPNVSTALLDLEIKLDGYPFETYWELTNDQGQILYYDGNRKVKYPNESAAGSFPTANALLNYQVALPANDCYAFTIYDRNNDGLEGNAYYKLKDGSGMVLLQGGNFLSEETKPFGVINSAGTNNNAALLTMEPFPADFCFDHDFVPKVRVQNLGQNNIAKLVLQVNGQSTAYPDYTWTGSLNTGKITTVTMPSITVSSTDEITVSLVSVNDQPDEYGFKNAVARPSLRRVTLATNWLVDIQTDAKGHELYWEITDDAGAVLFSGGNTVVGANGGGLGIASPSDAGAYENNKHIVLNANMPALGCYHLKVVDDGGDGWAGAIFGVPNPYLKIRNNTVGVIVQTNGVFTDDFASNIEIASVLPSQEIAFAEQQLLLSPNPVSNILKINGEHIAHEKLLIRIVNAGNGQVVYNREILTDGNGLNLSLPVHSLPNGLMMLTATTASGTIAKPFLVQH
jgi:thiol-disulfide isomerase/thioredoxin